jgi:hypothetical protein
MQSKVLAKIEQIARYRVLGMRDSRVAQILGMSYGGLSRILATPEYKQIEASVRISLVGKLDAKVEQQRVSIIEQQMREDLANAVPDALKFIIDTARQGQDLRARLAASREVLDRDPKRLFVKASRNEVVNPNAQSLPDAVLANVRSEADKATDILSQIAPNTKVAEA